MLTLRFKERKALLCNVNPRSEIHGAEREPAADLKIRVDCDNGILAEFDPALRSLLYFKDSTADTDGRNDLVDQANDSPNLRLPYLDNPLRWSDEMLNATVTVHHGIGGKSDLVLMDVKVNSFSIDAREGGTISLTFRVQCHPDANTLGKLAVQVQNEIDITLEPNGVENE